MYKYLVSYLRGLWLVPALCIVQFAHGEQSLYPLGYLDSVGIVKIDSRVGASRAEMECIGEIKLGHLSSVIKRCRKFVDTNSDDIVAWFLLIDATARSKAPLQSLMRELDTRSHSIRSEAAGQHFRLLVWHASRLAVIRSDSRASDVNASIKLLAEGQLPQPEFSLITGQTYRPSTSAEAFLLFDCLNQTSSGTERRDMLRYSVKRFNDYRLKLMLVRSLSQGSGAYLNVPAIPSDPKEALRVAKSTYQSHPEDPVASYMYGMLLSMDGKKTSVPVLERYLKMPDVYEPRRNKAKAALARLLSGKS